VWVEQLNEQGMDLLSLTQGLLRDKFQLEAALDEVRNIHGELREKLEALTAPQLYPAVITDASTRTTGTVEVYGAGMTINVAVHPDIAPDQLRVGAHGILARERNCLIEVRPSRPAWNEAGSFEG